MPEQKETNTWESLEETPIGTVIRGLVPDDNPMHIMVSKFLQRTTNGHWLYEIEIVPRAQVAAQLDAHEAPTDSD
jgi:hypothetical protein